MSERDWDFAFGDLGSPLADIQWWMTPPFPQWMFRKEAKDGQGDGRHHTVTTGRVAG